jgi:hypothetical protein
MKYRITLMGLILLGITFNILFTIKCSKENAVKDNSSAKRLLNKYYPKALEKDYDLVVRYESKDEPSKWEGFSWKRDNDLLEKSGLLKQEIIDTVINFYNHSHATFENKHQFFYKVIVSSKLNSYISEPQYRIKKFDEYDNFNKGTGRITMLNCKVVYGFLNLDKIANVEQKNPPYSTEIQYYERFSPTPFNDIISYKYKYYEGELLMNKVIVNNHNQSKLKIDK